jgi:hypothetical protein
MPTKKTPAAKAPANAKAQRSKPEAADAPDLGSKDARKLVRDSFTMPKAEYAAIDLLKARALGLGRHAKKSEILRAGLRALLAMSDRSLTGALNAVPTLKTGRPKGDEAGTVKEAVNAPAKKTAGKAARTPRKQSARGRSRPAGGEAVAPDAAS